MRRLLTLALASIVPALAQGGKAEIYGSVQDPSGLPVVKAAIAAVDTATESVFRSASGPTGEYHLLGLPAGSYVLTVEQPGFRTYRQSGITLRVGEQSRIDVALTVGEPAESVSVTAAAPLLETSNGEVRYYVAEKEVSTFPLDGRNFVPLVALSPGVALPGGGSLLPRINGSRPRTNEYLYDGISALQPEPGQVAFYPIIDAIEEFRLNLNSYSPEHGRSNGGTVIVNTKSGGNDFHGDVFEFLRNEALNARNFFAPAGAAPEFRRNQYGFTFGGPIRRNKTFFFVDDQETRLRTAVTRISTVPTVAERQGVFPSTIYDPATPDRTPFANNAIPASRFDPLGLEGLNRYPLPNSPGAANNFRRTAVEPDNQDQADLRIDHSIGEKHRLFARYSWLRDDDNPVTPLPDGSGNISSGVISHTRTAGDEFAGDYDWALSPSVLNQARIGYTRRNSNAAGPNNNGIAIPGTPANAFPNAMPTFTVAGFQQIGPPSNSYSQFATSVTEYMDTLSIVRGTHTLKFGADIRREALDALQPPNPAGLYAFNVTGTNKLGIANSGNPVASLLLGQVSSFSIDLQSRTLQERAHIAEFFIGDEWKATNRLSLNFGTRYTLNFPSTETHNRGAVFNLNSQALEFPHTARELECCDFGPRAGLAYRLSDSLVVRSGYGMVWFEQTGITTPFTLPQFPFIQTIGLQSQDNVNAAFLLSNGPGVQPTPPNPNSGLGQGVFGVDRHVGSGYSQQWNLSVQKSIGPDISFEVGYVGSKNTRLGVPDVNLNQLPAADLSLGPALLAKVSNPFYGQIPASSSLGGALITAQQLLRAYPRFTTVSLFRDNVGNSTYESLQARLEKRFSHGLTFTFAYTLSKLIDDASSVFAAAIFTGPVANYPVADSFNRRLEKDLSNGDIPRIFSAGWVYEIPRWWKLSGFEIGGLVRIQSGDTVAISQATNFNSSLGYGVQRPNRIGDPNSFPGRSVAEWFDAAAFTIAPQFTIGNSSRNPIRGPGLQNADLVVAKTFALRERIRLQIRGEAFNVANTPQFADPNAVLGSPAFATIGSAANPRVFELSGKIVF